MSIPVSSIVLDVSEAWLCLCVVLDLNAIVTEALPCVNANVTVIHSASASPGWMANLQLPWQIVMIVSGVVALRAGKKKTDIMLHGSSVRHSILYLTMWYCLFLLDIHTPWKLPALMSNLFTTVLLTLLFWPFDFSSTPVCHPSKGPNCVTRPHCHLPMRNQRKSSACCLLAEGGKSGKAEKNTDIFFHIMSYKWVHIIFIVGHFIFYCASSVINIQYFVWIPPAVCTIALCLWFLCPTHRLTHRALQTALSVISIFTTGTQIHLCSQKLPNRVPGKVLIGFLWPWTDKNDPIPHSSRYPIQIAGCPHNGQQRYQLGACLGL